LQSTNRTIQVSVQQQQQRVRQPHDTSALSKVTGDINGGGNSVGATVRRTHGPFAIAPTAVLALGGSAAKVGSGIRIKPEASAAAPADSEECDDDDTKNEWHSLFFKVLQIEY
jgi:hypothetical protein